MENRINQIIELENGKKLIITKQAIYRDENYFIAAKISDDEKEVYEEFHLFHEFDKNGITHIETVTDAKLADLLMKNFDQN